MSQRKNTTSPSASQSTKQPALTKREIEQLRKATIRLCDTAAALAFGTPLGSDELGAIRFLTNWLAIHGKPVTQQALRDLAEAQAIAERFD